MTDPYAPPQHWSDSQVRQLRWPLPVRIAVLSAVPAFLLAFGLLVWSTLAEGGDHDWSLVAFGTLVFASPFVFLFLAVHGQEWARQCFLLFQGALMLWWLMLAVVVLSSGNWPRTLLPFALGLLIATSVFCMQHGTTKAWLVDLRARRDQDA